MIATDQDHATGLRKVSEATVEQLDRRLRKAEEWLRRVEGQRAG